MFTISCCNLKDFIFKSPKPWRFLETTFPLLCSSNIYLSTCLTSTMSYVPRKFQKYTTFYYYLFLFFCRHFFVYTNFLDSWDTILDRTIQIQFTYLQKKRLRICTVFCGSCFFKQIFEYRKVYKYA